MKSWMIARTFGSPPMRSNALAASLVTRST
jgi:hypothetical protein